MEPELRRRVEEAFHRALELEPPRRAALLDELRAADGELAAEVDSMLALQSRAEGFLEDSPLEGVTGAGAPAIERIGGYRVLDVLGSGGMGVVYRAEQESPRRTVALKVVQPMLATPRHLRRFEEEARVLARLQHPGIAQIFEAGTFDAGSGEQPFFAMELVEGAPLTELAASRDLGLRARLRLVAEVAEAIHHAHQRGVVHRDLKPANVLVGEDGHPKILDFGVARLTDADVRAASLCTAAGQILGTLAYMSPEQVGGDPEAVDLRSDVYSLGVVGYELLSGRLPLELGGRSLAEAARVLTEERPPSLGALDPRLRGDVETIFAKALAKEPDRRYPSAWALAADIDRHLRHEPIVARPSSVTYQLGKLARRHRALVVSAALAAVSLVAGTAVAVWQAREARGERDRAVEAEALADARRVEAEEALAKAEAARDFLRGVLKAADPYQERGEDLRLTEVLERAAERAGRDLADAPAVRAVVQAAIGEDYHVIGLADRAAEHLRDALAASVEANGREHPDSAYAVQLLAVVEERRGRIAEADELAKEALELARSVYGEPDLRVSVALDCCGRLAGAAGRYEESVDLHRRALAMTRELRPDDGVFAARSLTALGKALFELRRFDEARDPLEEALAHLRAAGDREPGMRSQALSTLASLEGAIGDHDAAEALAQEQVDLDLEVLGDAHPRVALGIGKLGNLAMGRGELDRAEDLLREAHGRLESAVDRDHPWLIGTRSNLALALSKAGRLDEAEELQRRLVDDFVRTRGERHPLVARAQKNHGMTLWRLGRLEEAREVLEAAHGLRSDVYPDGYAGIADGLNGLAMLSVVLGEPGVAEGQAREAIEIWAAAHGAASTHVRFAEVTLGRALTGLGAFEEAEGLLRRAVEHFEADEGEAGTLRAEALDALVLLYEAWPRPELAGEARARWVVPDGARFWPGPFPSR